MTDYLPLPGTPLEELDTPCIVVDLDIAESNIEKLQAAANEMGVEPSRRTNSTVSRPPLSSTCTAIDGT